MSRFGPAGGYPDQPGEPDPGQWEEPHRGHRGGEGRQGGWQTQPGGWDTQPGDWQGQQNDWQGQQGGWQTQPGGWQGQQGDWQGRRPDPGYPQGGGDPYRQPADPWSHGQESWADLTRPQPGYQDAPETLSYDQSGHHRSPYPTGNPGGPGGPGGAGGPGGPEGPEWEELPPRRRTGALVALVSVLVLLIAGGIAAALFWISGDDEDPGLTGADQPSAPASGDAADDDENGEAGPQDRIGMGAVVAQADDCLVNDGSDNEPVMRIVPCDTDEDTRVYLVLSRADQQVTGGSAEEQDSSAHEICGEVDGYEYHYRFVGPTEEESFVLCMSQE